MTKRPDGKSGSEKVTFTRQAAERIARAVRKIEAGDRDCVGLTFSRPIDGGKSPVRLCKTTQAWARNTQATLEVWESGDAPDEQPSIGQSSNIKTLIAYNKSYNVAACVWVLVAKGQNGEWYLVEAAVPFDSESCDAPNIGGHDLTTVSGYASNKKQALTHDENACLKWVDIESCET